VPEDVDRPYTEKAWNSQDLGSQCRALIAIVRGSPLTSPCAFLMFYVHWYLCTYRDKVSAHCIVERVQMGVRIEKRLLKVMKALAECHGVTLGDLIE